MKTLSDAPVKKMVLSSDIVDDPGVLVAIEELFGEHRDYIAQGIILTEDDIE